MRRGNLKRNPPFPPAEPQTHRISFPWAETDAAFPVMDFPGRTMIKTTLQVQFVNRHVWYTIVVLEERNHPLP